MLLPILCLLFYSFDFMLFFLVVNYLVRSLLVELINFDYKLLDKWFDRFFVCLIDLVGQFISPMFILSHM